MVPKRCSPRNPENSAFSFFGATRGADSLPWETPAERALLSPPFVRAALGQIQPFRCFSSHFEWWFFFSPPLNAVFVGNAGDGKDAPWRTTWGETPAEEASYPGSDHIR